jgi:hypothetical protein
MNTSEMFVNDTVKSGRLYNDTDMTGVIIDINRTTDIRFNDYATIRWENGQVAKFYLRHLDGLWSPQIGGFRN